ncbi:MAG: tripartite tricarboxylate transporter substrate binding protein [Burkholderiaceae bacterium]|nr:tripartite tricarboxylate transporter substrate binding protein [Pseudomonadota bacterium]MBS0597414.1 tripartite tricarboxylate transporter substrate binding protein [Pseudomonadota bacterium]MCO5115719.1 tripartite tricarboxylate transporter substrate binding protein [Burkholderiaceae bacterium]MCP5218596.1 tripartite tricarboxylate transporter substrate binding protein [Burkholderiaceae bacterium]
MKKALAGIVLGLASAVAFAWPTKTVTIIVPFPPGGSTDMIARTISAELGQKIGGTVVVDNKGGATGTIGTAQVARSEPDGHTLLVSSLGPFVIAPHLIKAQYDALKDLDPITVAVRAPNVLVVPAASRLKSLADVLAYLKANPGKMSFATSGAGSSDHLTSELFWQQTGTSGLHVPYKGGGPVMTDLLGNQVDSSFMNINTALPQIRAGKLRPLVITSAKRSPLLPDVPTMDESGIKDADVYSWQAVAGPHGMPAELKERLQGAIAAILRQPATKAKLEELGFELVLNTPAEFAKYQADEYARWGKLIRERKITAN